MQKGDNMGYITTEEDKDKFLMHPKRFEALEKRVEILEKKHQELIDNLRIFMVNDEEEFAKEQ
tara:strand:+ start:144 stop:332 length:189 start_codon:yes stop_codon:yes gene_type:complete